MSLEHPAESRTHWSRTSLRSFGVGQLHLERAGPIVNSYRNGRACMPFPRTETTRASPQATTLLDPYRDTVLYPNGWLVPRS